MRKFEETRYNSDLLYCFIKGKKHDNLKFFDENLTILMKLDEDFNISKLHPNLL